MVTICSTWHLLFSSILRSLSCKKSSIHRSCCLEDCGQFWIFIKNPVIAPGISLSHTVTIAYCFQKGNEGVWQCLSTALTGWRGLSSPWPGISPEAVDLQKVTDEQSLRSSPRDKHTAHLKMPQQALLNKECFGICRECVHSTRAFWAGICGYSVLFTDSLLFGLFPALNK